MKSKDDGGMMSRSSINALIEMINSMISEPYYLLHFLTFFSYFPIRFAASQFLSDHFTSHLLHREIQALLAFSVLTVVKIVKEETWEGFIADTLFFGKVFLAAIALVLDYHLSLWFTLAFLVIYVFTQQPAYAGIGTSSHLTPLQLEALLTEGNTSRYWLEMSIGLNVLCKAATYTRQSAFGEPVTFRGTPSIFGPCFLFPSALQMQSLNSIPMSAIVVEFRTSSSSTCIRTSRVLPDLSIIFSNKNLSFGIVDLGLFPNTSEKFGISLGKTEQLPTFILYENSEEVTRFPELDFESKYFNTSITKKHVCQHFELDRLLLEYVKGNLEIDVTGLKIAVSLQPRRPLVRGHSLCGVGAGLLLHTWDKAAYYLH